MTLCVLLLSPLLLLGGLGRVAPPSVEAATPSRAQLLDAIPSAHRTRYAARWEVSDAAASVGLWVEDTLIVANCESGVDTDGDLTKDAYDSWAVGPYLERGIMQIHPMHARPDGVIERLGYTWNDMFDVVPNLAVSRAIWDALGWGGWSCERALKAATRFAES